MGTTSEKLNHLIETKKQIKEAIINKNVEVSDSDSFRSYAEKINSIQLSSGMSAELYVQSSTPPTSTTDPTMWIDTSNGTNVLKVHDKTKWITVRGTWA